VRASWNYVLMAVVFSLVGGLAVAASGSLEVPLLPQTGESGSAYGTELSLEPDREEIDQSGPFHGPDDLSGALGIGWTPEGLRVTVGWVDDEWDTVRRGRDEAIWTSADGSRRDAMYFHDGLKVQLRHGDYNYTVWLSPRKDPYQWHGLHRARQRVESPAPEVEIGFEDDALQMRLLIPWDSIGLTSAENQNLRAVFLLADSDEPGRDDAARSDAARSESTRYLAWSGELKLIGSLSP